MVTHNTDRKRFVITVDGETAEFADYVTPDDVRDFNHTVINLISVARAILAAD